MRRKGLLAILFLFLCFFSISAQNTNEASAKPVLIDADANLIFDKTIDYLQNNGYFIVSLDKQAGFIQAKIFVENKKILSAKEGERRTLNFIISPIESERSKITLLIYIEEQFFNMGSSDRVFYYRDKGVSHDSSLYKNIMDSLRDSF